MLSIVIPVFNERDNIHILVSRVKTLLHGQSFEIIFVDDNSPDKTIFEVWKLAQKDPHIRGILRIGRKGLASAVNEGILASSSELIIVMDGDLQHDEHCIPRMVEILNNTDASICVASRYLESSTEQGLANQWRVFLSKTGIMLTQRLSGKKVSDPLSGFFAIKRKTYVDVAPFLFLRGYKILLDILTVVPSSTKITEIPMHFRKRASGKSKLNMSVLFDFILFIVYAYFRKVFMLYKK